MAFNTLPISTLYPLYHLFLEPEKPAGSLMDIELAGITRKCELLTKA